MMNYRDWVALSMLPGVGIITAHKLIQTFTSPTAALQSDPNTLKAFNLPQRTLQAISDYSCERGAIIEYLNQLENWLASPTNHLVCFDAPGYPQMLREIADPPLILYVTGAAERLCYPQIAIVGSRNASVSGLQHAENFSRALSEAGLTVTSGLALGVDGAAHSGAVGLNLPTIAVLGTGIDRIYPRRHNGLAEAILANGGALVSELPLGTAPLAHNFPRRNRIISGLSAGVLVIEAASRSGSLITAKQALQQGREVFALPGALNNPQSHGCHALIREGAVLVETVGHIQEQLGALLGGYEQDEQKDDTETLVISDADAWLLELMGYELCSLEQLIERSAKPAAELISQLVAMELNNYIEKMPEGYLRLI